MLQVAELLMGVPAPVIYWEQGHEWVFGDPIRLQVKRRRQAELCHAFSEIWDGLVCVVPNFLHALLTAIATSMKCSNHRLLIRLQS